MNLTKQWIHGDIRGGEGNVENFVNILISKNKN